jgi:hypothetical protein
MGIVRDAERSSTIRLLQLFEREGQVPNADLQRRRALKENKNWKFEGARFLLRFSR